MEEKAHIYFDVSGTIITHFLMRFGKKKNWQHFIYNWYAVAFLLLIVVFFSFSVWERYRAAHVMKERLEASEKEAAALKTHKEQLSEQVEYLKGERGIEEELRRNFDVAKPGEQVIVLTGRAERVSATTSDVTVSAPWWQFWR